MNIFKGLIKCKLCNKNYNYKNDRGVIYYICSGYKNYGSDFCKGQRIKVDDLIYLVQKHCEMKNKEYELTNKSMKSLIKVINVYANENMEIIWMDKNITKYNDSKIVF